MLIAVGKHAQVADMLIKIMNNDQNDIYAQDMFATLLKDQMPVATSYRNRLVLGIGTGRSGSTSLTHLFGSQAATYCSHEFPPLIPWNTDGDQFQYQFHLERFNRLFQKWDFVCDVSHWWLPRIEAILASGYDLKVVAVKRDRDATVDSFLRIKGGGGPGSINHWVEHDGKFWRENFWDSC